MISPYNTVHKFAAIALDDVEGRTIGDATGGANEISNSLYGIYSHNASVTVLNTDFHDIWDNASPHLSGSCIYSSSDYDFNNRKITLGDPSNLAGGANTFKSSLNGLTGMGEMNYFIYSNTFGNGTFADRLLENCIGISNNGSKEIVIQDQNNFYDYRHGIDIAAPRGKLFIHDNTFWNATFPSGASNFEGTAINVYGFFKARLTGSEISLNTIGESGSSNTDQPRIGIRLSMLDNMNVNDNAINFHLGSSVAEEHRGIWATFCDDLKLDNNDVLNHTTYASGNGDLLTGIRIENSMNSCIENSTLDHLGFGMRFFGASVVQSFYLNTFTHFDEGVHLETADIGPTVGTEDPPGSGYGNVMGNAWYLCNGCTATTKISGSIMGVLTWFTDVNSGARYPDNNVPGLTIIQLGSATELSECQLSISSEAEEDYGNTMSLRRRNESFGSVVADTARYPEEYATELRLLAREAVFKIFRKHPGLLYRDDDSDTSFISFYNGLLSSKIYKTDSLDELIRAGNYALADTLLNHFTSTNDFEYNYKLAYRYALKWLMYGDTAITDTERDELNVIAHTHPVDGGLAVYLARNMLHLEIYDEELSSSRLMQPKAEKKERSTLIYPNPANEYVIVQLSNKEYVDQIRVVDITGRVCLVTGNSSMLNTFSLSPGIYFVKALSKGEEFNGSFIINR